MKLTHRELVLNFLLLTGHPYTASEIWHALNLPEHPIKLSSLSGILKRMYDAGELRRIDEWGPRGGYGYEVNHS